MKIKWMLEDFTAWMSRPYRQLKSKVKDILWRLEFAMTPVKKLGNGPDCYYVKEFKGGLYVVDVEDITPKEVK
jgi:hypothetical protein